MWATLLLRGFWQFVWSKRPVREQAKYLSLAQWGLEPGTTRTVVQRFNNWSTDPAIELFSKIVFQWISLKSACGYLWLKRKCSYSLYLSNVCTSTRRVCLSALLLPLCRLWRPCLPPLCVGVSFLVCVYHKPHCLGICLPVCFSLSLCYL